MPHPERFVTMLQHPQQRSSASRQADGLLIFKNAYEYCSQHLRHSPQKTYTSYSDSGVDIAAGEQAVKLMKDAVRATQSGQKF